MEGVRLLRNSKGATIEFTDNQSLAIPEHI